MSDESKKKATETELMQLIESIEMLHSSLLSLSDSVEDFYLQSDMPGAAYLKDITLDLIKKIRR